MSGNRLEQKAQFNQRAMVEDALIILGSAGSVRQVVIELAERLGHVHNPHQIVAGAEPGTFTRMEVKEESGFVEMAEEGLTAAVVRTHETIAPLQVDIHRQEVRAPGTLG